MHLAFGPIYGPEGSMLPRVEAFNRETASPTPHAPHPITPHQLPDLVREVSPLRDRRALGQIRNLIDAIKPDIVHTHSSKAGILGRLGAWKHVARGAKIGIVHTIHGPPFMPVEGGILARLKIRAANRAYTLAERRAANNCHLIVSVADAMTEQFLARGIGRPEQFVTVRSGMETAPFLDAAPGESREEVRAELGLPDDAFVIGTVARLAQHKGHDDILDAIGEDLQQHPSWRLLWVGDGWWRDRLMGRVRSMGLEDRVTVTGLVPPEKIPAMLRAMDLLVHPSYREGLPRTVPQALLAGVCPVAYDADGTREACIDNKTGRLVPVGDRAALAASIRWLWEHPADRKRMAAEGRTHCREAFSAEAMVHALEDVYQRALKLASK
ncbi:MAG: glycosyltransferase family 1 protein [Phycisphaerales bacterium]|nr:MAG: glycosyltransferase family 1 protein [Phycisphaerales bacterium]